LQQSLITGGQQRVSLSSTQFIRCAVAPGLFDKGKGAVIGDEETFEKSVRSIENLMCPSPYSLTADFSPWTAKPRYRSFGMHLRRFSDGCFNTQPVSDRFNITERDTGLDHAPGSGIHPHKDDLLRRQAVTGEILIISRPGIYQWIVDMGNRWPETKGGKVFDQLIGDGLVVHRINHRRVCVPSQTQNETFAQFGFKPGVCYM